MSAVSEAMGNIETALEQLIVASRKAAGECEDHSDNVWHDIGKPLDDVVSEAEKTLAASRAVLAEFISKP